ncbi:MAG: Exodeoxyribonuclease 7 small subunit [Alphaproteobacteria bacterium MarineAlpha11_Bin1]|nr:MAG: Exodeoxyribonuclease 7 small subunit [Alphaproteobacteria bacterium MarineAlpha11_Bin1]|tara:strand:+ start:6227 stop:6478 length:252 start_codon:yes stop_codon:yes gene_type:complete
MTDNDKMADINEMSFEDALQELEEIVRNLEGGKGRLEDSIIAYERGSKLKAHCEKKLKEAQAKVDEIALGANGEANVRPADIE